LSSEVAGKANIPHEAAELLRHPLLGRIGNTPLVELMRIPAGTGIRVFAKLESANPGGSVKDRAALAIVLDAEKKGDLRRGGTIVEGTSGNTGAGLARACIQKGYHAIFVMPDKMSQEKIRYLKALGAQVISCPTAVAPEDPRSYYSVSRRLAEETPNAILADQYFNPVNPQTHYETTGPEIWEQTNGEVDAIVVGVGSSGTISGLTACFRRIAPHLEIVLADPKGSILADYIKTGELGEGGSWLVEGIGEDFIPDICDLSMVKSAYTVSDGESFAAARELLLTEGVLAGSSTGTLLSAALRFCREQTEPKTVVCFACDTGNKYLSKLYNDFWMEDQGFIKREQTGDLRDLIGRPHGERATSTVGPSDILTTAHNRLRNAGFSQLPVMQEGELVGVVTEETILRFAFGKPELLNAEVSEAMESSFIKLDVSSSVNNLVAMLQVQPYAAILDDGRFLGLITRSDVLNHLRKQV